MKVQNEQRKNSDGADLLRGVAILMVVSYHLANITIPWAGWTRDFGTASGVASLTKYPLSLGWSGVSLFFVLSGFCIELSTLRAGGLNRLPFFWRRFWRIYPAYLVSLVVFAVAARVDVASPEGFRQIITHVLMLHNFDESTFFAINPSFWSIATEIQLYLLFPFFVALRTRVGARGALLAAFVIGCAWRLMAVLAWGVPDHVINPAFTSPLCCWFDWILGAYVAGRYFEGRTAFARPIGWLALLVPLFVASTYYKPATLFSFTLASAIGAVVLDLAVRTRWRMHPPATALFHVGLISYSVYLWHQPVMVALKLFLRPWMSVPAIVVVTFLLVTALGWLSYHLLERPGIQLGRVLWDRLQDRKRAWARRLDIIPVEV